MALPLLPLSALTQSVVASYTLLFQNESDDDDDDEEAGLMDHELQALVQSYRREVPARLKLFVEVTIPISSEIEFRRDFRVTRTTYEKLLQLIGPMLTASGNTGRKKIKAENQVLAVLWLLATPDSYRSVGKKFDMGKSSLFVSFYRVIHALNVIAPAIIRWPNAEERTRNERAFRRFARVRGVIGAVDGSYVPIKAPKIDSHVYINRKCFYGVTLQAICDNKLRFLNCYAGYPSSVSDCRIFKNSPIYHKMSTQYGEYFNEQQYIIGDKAYPCKRFCIPPFVERSNITQAQKHFNTRHASTRQVIERSFALLFGRFRRLRYLDMNRTDLIPYTIVAACVLHNLCLNCDEELDLYIEEGNAFLEEMNNGHLQLQLQAAADGAMEAALVPPVAPADADDIVGVQIRNLLTAELYGHQ